MQKQKSGSIINISSMAGRTSWEASSQYSASKSGVIGLTRSVAMDLAHYGATANALCPGNTLTDMVKNVPGLSAIGMVCRDRNGLIRGPMIVL